MRDSKIILLSLLTFFLYHCQDPQKAILGNWDCEVILGDSTGIGFSYKMSFTKEKQWIPNLSQDLKLEYKIRKNQIITQSNLGLNVYSDFTLFENKLKIDTLGLLSECTRERKIYQR